MPAHAHTVYAVDTDGNKTVPLEAFPAAVAGGTPAIYGTYPSQTSQGTTLSEQTIASSGGGQPHENRQPTLAVHYCIAMSGYYPPRT